jgi:hypothetical protein
VICCFASTTSSVADDLNLAWDTDESIQHGRWHLLCLYPLPSFLCHDLLAAIAEHRYFLSRAQKQKFMGESFIVVNT